jgi:imidazoleglycerol-phosphate dehydratase
LFAKYICEIKGTGMSEKEARVATIVRETGESKIAVTVNLDGTGQVEVDTPIGFLKHMLS